MLIGYLFFKVDWWIIYTAFSKINIKLYLLSTLLELVGIFILASKYYYLIRGTSVARSVGSLTKINLMTRFYALFLPSAVGTEAVRWYKVTRNERERVFFMASIVFERSTFVFFLLVGGLIPLFLYSPGPGVAAFKEAVLPLVLAFLVLSIMVIAYLLLPAVQVPIKSIILKLVPSHGRWQIAGQLLENFSLKNTSVALPVFALGVLWYISFIARMVFLINALDIPLGVADIVWMSSLVLLLQSVPISVAGIGVREGAYAYLFTLFSLSPEYGVLTGIVFFSQVLLFAIVGGLLELVE